MMKNNNFSAFYFYFYFGFRTPETNGGV